MLNCSAQKHPHVALLVLGDQRGVKCEGNDVHCGLVCHMHKLMGVEGGVESDYDVLGEKFFILDVRAAPV